MAESELRTFFAPNRSQGISAQDVFTNRIGETAAFWESVAALELRQPWDAVEDLAQPRKNVLVFYGRGGIGKSALSRRLHRIASEPTNLHRLTVATINLEEPAMVDLETILLRLRSELGRGRHRFAAFDLAIQAYWQQAHPGLSLDEFASSNSLVARAADAAGLSEHLRIALEDVSHAALATAVPASIGLRGVTRLVDLIRSSARTKRLRNRCWCFDALLDQPIGDDTLAYFAALLAWDIAQQQRETTWIPVILLDGFEALTARGPHAEALIQRIVFLIPNALFVLTGRNRVDWSERSADSNFAYTGESVWPQLSTSATAEPRQHLLSKLSPADCEDYLRTALVDSDGAPAVPSHVRERISTGSDGLPLYLDLAVHQFLVSCGDGSEPVLEEFGHPLPAVIARTMRDLDAPERAALRGAALLRACDMELVAAAGGVADAIASRLLKRPFIEHDPASPLPFVLHASLRQGVREVDAQLDDAWSEREWVASAKRILDELGTRFESQRRVERSQFAALVQDGLDAASLVGDVPAWLRNASRDATDRGLWSIFAGLPDPQGLQSEYDAFALALKGIAARRTSSQAESTILLDRALSAGLLAAEDRSFFAVHAAHTARNGGAYAEAEDRYRQLASDDDQAVALRARYQLADLAMLRGQFKAVSVEPPDEAGELAIEWLRLKGHIERFNAQFERAATTYRFALNLARSRGDSAAEAKTLVNIAEALVWYAPAPDVLESVDLAARATETAVNGLDLVKLAAVKVHRVSLEPLDCERAVEEGLALVQRTNYRAGELFVRLAECFAAHKRNDMAVAHSTTRRIRDLSSELGVYGFLGVIANGWATDRQASDVIGDGWDSVDWLDTPSTTAMRWISVLS